MKFLNLMLFALLFSSLTLLQAEETITFTAKDGLEVSADLYLTDHSQGPFIILFHQAGWSRGEYLEIAPKLNALGYNCLAVDQRSGEQVNGIMNLTAKRAKEQGLSTHYPDALPDMLAAIAYVKATYQPQKLILWGSSYSSALVLKIAGDEPTIADAVLAFAPGEYFKGFGQAEDWITQSAKHIKIPAFITSAKKEHEYWKGIFEAIPGTTKRSFLPASEGNHGSRALWEQFEDHQSYWEAVTKFLKSI